MRAKNGQWIDNLPATRGWTIDATPPETSIGTSDTSGRDASFGFSGFLADAGATDLLMLLPREHHDSRIV